MLLGLLAPEAAKVKYFPFSVQNGGAMGLIFPDDSLFSQLNFPSPPEARSALPMVAQGSLTRAQLFNSKDVAFRTSWVS